MVFHFQDTMLLQSFGLMWRKRGRERERGSAECNIWSAHGDVVILNSLARHTEGIKLERGREREPEREEGGRGGGRGTEGGREGGRERGTREREVQRERERVSGVKEQTLHVAVEGVMWLWRGTNSQVRQTLRKHSAQMRTSFSTEWKREFSWKFSQLFHCDRVSFLWEPASVFPSLVFSTLSFCPLCWLHVFFGVWSWELCRFWVAA